jgi:hypothetical protein
MIYSAEMGSGGEIYKKFLNDQFRLLSKRGYYRNNSGDFNVDITDGWHL